MSIGIRNSGDLTVARINEHVGEEVWIRYLHARRSHVTPRHISAICAILISANEFGIGAGNGMYEFKEESQVRFHGGGGIVSIRRTSDGFYIYDNEDLERQVSLALVFHTASVHKLAVQEMTLAALVRHNQGLE